MLSHAQTLKNAADDCDDTELLNRMFKKDAQMQDKHLIKSDSQGTISQGKHNRANSNDRPKVQGIQKPGPLIQKNPPSNVNQSYQSQLSS